MSKSRKKEKKRKVKKSTSQKVRRPRDLCSKSIEKSKKTKSRKAENFLTLCEKFHPKSKKNKNEESKSRKLLIFCKKCHSKSRKNRNIENFLTFCLFAKSFATFALCDYQVRGALRFFGGSTINGQFMGFLRETKHHGSPWGYTSIATQDCWMPLVNSHRHGNHHVFHRL